MEYFISRIDEKIHFIHNVSIFLKKFLIIFFLFQHANVKKLYLSNIKNKEYRQKAHAIAFRPWGHYFEIFDFYHGLILEIRTFYFSPLLFKKVKKCKKLEFLIEFFKSFN